jgi:hypothetical protein
MLYGFLIITKTTRFIAVPVPPSQIVFSQYHFAMKKPHEDLDLQGYFHFPNIFLRYLVSSFRRSKYIDLTVNIPEVVKFQVKLSFSFVNSTLISRCTRCSHIFHRFPVRVRRKAMFKGFWYSFALSDSTFMPK